MPASRKQFTTFPSSRHAQREGIRAESASSVLSARVRPGHRRGAHAQSHGLTRLYAKPDTTAGVPGLELTRHAILQDALYYASPSPFTTAGLRLVCTKGTTGNAPTHPWTSFAFDPPEAVVQALVLVCW